jgi:hypothetical protein
MTSTPSAEAANNWHSYKTTEFCIWNADFAADTPAVDLLGWQDVVLDAGERHQIFRFESADAAAMQQILRRDAAIELPGSRTWLAGNRTCVAFLRDHALGNPGDWRMLPTVVNGQPAAAAYLRANDGIHRAFGIAVLTTADDGIGRITVFNEPALVGRCGLPDTAPGRPV